MFDGELHPFICAGQARGNLASQPTSARKWAGAMARTRDYAGVGLVSKSTIHQPSTIKYMHEVQS